MKDIIGTIANVLRIKRENAEERNSYTAGQTCREIGELALIVIDLTDAIRIERGNDLANLFCRLAHPTNAAQMRAKKKKFNLGLGLDN